MQTIALVDANHGRGHHLTYMRFFCKTLLNLGYRVISFYPDPVAVTDWLQSECPQHLDNFHAFEIGEHDHRKLPVWGEIPSNLELPFIGKVPSNLQPLIVLARWRYTAELIQKAVKQVGFEPDLVFLNWLDDYFSYFLTHHLIDLIFPYNWSGIYFRPGDLRFKKLSLIPHYATARSPRCKALTLLDEEFAQTIVDKLDAPVIPFPDLTDEAGPDPNLDIIKQIREKAGNRKIIGLIGALSKRKGLLTFLEVAEKSIDKDWFFVMAGPLNQSTFHQEYNQRLADDFKKVQSILESPPDNCFFHLQSIPDGPQFNAFINAFDILFAAYENFPYSSNILTKAAVFQKPVIVSDGFCMAKRVQQFQFGVSIPEGDVAECIQAIQQLCDSPSQDMPQFRFDFDGYKQLHSTERLGQIFQSLLGSREMQTALAVGVS
ncbi:MAG: glycosyltransferase family 4 protein [Leptolyngbya sp. SIO1D8]|nr:glycosyltransferase family 4 protein [Leptolyngbya sp. SIO1D8]